MTLLLDGGHACNSLPWCVLEPVVVVVAAVPSLPTTGAADDDDEEEEEQEEEEAEEEDDSDASLLSSLSSLSSLLLSLLSLFLLGLPEKEEEVDQLLDFFLEGSLDVCELRLRLDVDVDDCCSWGVSSLLDGCRGSAATF